MKKLMIFSILILSILLINGCAQEDVDIGIPTSICKFPYIEYKVGECCVDTNSNSICDNDEKIKEETKETSDVEHSSVRAIISESCNFGRWFDCPWFYIARNEIQLKLVAELPLVYIKEIKIPNENCENVKVDKLLKFDESINVNIPCKFEKDSVSSQIVVYHIKEFEFDSEENLIKERFDSEGNIQFLKDYNGYITLTTVGNLEGIVRESKESKTEEAIQGVIEEKCAFTSDHFRCLKPFINKSSVNFYIKNEGRRLNLTRVEIPNIPCSKDINISFEKEDIGQRLISMECEFNKNTVDSDIIFYATIQLWNDNLKYFEDAGKYILRGKISGIVR